MLILRVRQTGPLQRYAIEQRIRQCSGDILKAEEGSLYPALQRMFVEGWAVGNWGQSETGRRVRFYKVTREGLKQLFVIMVLLVLISACANLGTMLLARGLSRQPIVERAVSPLSKGQYGIDPGGTPGG